MASSRKANKKSIIAAVKDIDWQNDIDNELINIKSDANRAKSFLVTMINNPHLEINDLIIASKQTDTGVDDVLIPAFKLEAYYNCALKSDDVKSYDLTFGNAYKISDVYQRSDGFDMFSVENINRYPPETDIKKVASEELRVNLLSLKQEKFSEDFFNNLIRLRNHQNVTLSLNELQSLTVSDYEDLRQALLRSYEMALKEAQNGNENYTESRTIGSQTILSEFNGTGMQYRADAEVSENDLSRTTDLFSGRQENLGRESFNSGLSSQSVDDVDSSQRDISGTAQTTLGEEHSRQLQSDVLHEGLSTPRNQSLGEGRTSGESFVNGVSGSGLGSDLRSVVGEQDSGLSQTSQANERASESAAERTASESNDDVPERNANRVHSQQGRVDSSIQSESVYGNAVSAVRVSEFVDGRRGIGTSGTDLFTDSDRSYNQEGVYDISSDSNQGASADVNFGETGNNEQYRSRVGESLEHGTGRSAESAGKESPVFGTDRTDQTNVSGESTDSRYRDRTPEEITADTRRLVASIIEESERRVKETNEQRDNFKLDNDEESYTKTERVKNNLAALKTLYSIKSEKRHATDEERGILAKYSGWGGITLTQIDSIQNDLITDCHLNKSQIESIKNSALTAYYTPTQVIDLIYNQLNKMGLNQIIDGKLLEPGCGVGKFFGRMSEQNSSLKATGIEIDKVSADLASELYPNASIVNLPFNETTQKNYYDVAVGNVPFSQLKVYDKHSSDLNGYSLHNYFFLKTVEQLKPGAVAALITSSYTLDSHNNEVRTKIAQNAEFLGAVRLNNDTFKTSNTGVVSDIVFLRKRETPISSEEAQQEEWVNTQEVVIEGSYRNGTFEHPIEINSYFANHNEQIAGNLYAEWDGRFQEFKMDCRVNCAYYERNQQIEKCLNNITGEFNLEALDKKTNEEENLQNISAEENSTLKDLPTYSYYLDKSDNVWYHGSPYELPVRADEKVSSKNKKILVDLIKLRDQDRIVRKSQIEGFDESIQKQERNTLNVLYDRFISDAGIPKNKKGDLLCPVDYWSSRFKLTSNDSSFFALSYLENQDDEGNYLGKSEVFEKNVLSKPQVYTHAENASDALMMSINALGKVDIAYMTALLSRDDPQSVINELSGKIYRDPAKIEKLPNGSLNPLSGFVTEDEYLSGNIYKKIDDCEQFDLANNTDLFSENIEKLKEKIPQPLSAEQINVEIGARWIDPQDYVAFCKSIFTGCDGNIVYNAALDSYSCKDFAIWGRETFDYSVGRTKAADIIEACLNLQNLKITKSEIYYVNGEQKTRSVIDQEKTLLIQSKQDALKSKFKEWIFSDPDRRKRLEDKYNRQFNAIVPREYNGSLFSFEGLNSNIKLMEHQKNAIARTLLGGNALLAHEVGAGKTFEMCASALQKTRLGIAHKICIVTPKAVTKQFANEFYRLYPNANLLVVGQNDLSKNNRAKFLARMAYGDYDAILMTNEQFGNVPLSLSYQSEYFEKQKNILVEALEQERALSNSYKDSFSARKLREAINRIDKKFEDLKTKYENADYGITFEEIGIDALYVDEAHNFKNISQVTHINELAIPAGSNRADDLLMKCQYLNDRYNYRAVTFATGTPLSNSTVDLFTMQKYLNQPALDNAGIKTLDQFMANFGVIENKIELDPTGTHFQTKSRLSKFTNLQDAMKIFGEVADIKTQNMLNLNVPDSSIHIVEAEPSDFQKAKVLDLAKRAKDIKLGLTKKDNMLAVTNDGRKLGLDGRLIDPLSEDPVFSKVNLCAKQVAEIYKNTSDKNSTQIVFCDLSTPTGSKAKESGFCVYDDVKQKLIDLGVKENEIAFVHDYDKDEQREELFQKVNRGEIRVLFGSTQKLGTGVNVQKKLCAVHHLDINWKPSDIEQRNGRIIRQGNENKKVDLFYYVTKGTFDAYMYQTVDRKAKFIKQIMENKTDVRTMDLDEDNPTFSYAEVMMAALGDERVKQRVELETAISNLKLRISGEQGQIRNTRLKIEETLPKKLKELSDNVSYLEKDAEAFKSIPNGEKENSKVFSYNFISYAGAAKKPEEINKAFCHLLKGVKLNSRIDNVCLLNGFNISLGRDIAYSAKDLADVEQSVAFIQGPSGHEYVIHGNADGSGLYRKIQNELSKLPKLFDNNSADFKKAKDEYDAGKAYLETHSDTKELEAQLAAKETELQTLIAEIETETADETVDKTEDNSEEVNSEEVNDSQESLTTELSENEKAMLSDRHVIIASAPSAIESDYETPEYLDAEDMTEEEIKGRNASLRAPIVVAENKAMLRELLGWGLQLYGRYADFNYIDVSKVTDFSGIFKDCNFVGDISKWNVSNGTNFSRMFENSAFNGDLSHWDVSNAIDFSRMFADSQFNNSSVLHWDFAAVESPDGMFENNPVINQDFSTWRKFFNVDLMKKNMFKNCPYISAESFGESVQQQTADSVKKEIIKLIENAFVKNSGISTKM